MSYVLHLQNAPGAVDDTEDPNWRPTSTFSPISCYSTVSLAIC